MSTNLHVLDLLKCFRKVFNIISCSLNAETAGIDDQVISPGISPLRVAVEIVVRAAETVRFLALHIRFLRSDLLDPGQSLVLLLDIANYEDAQYIGIALQNRIRAAANDHAALSAGCDLPDILKCLSRDVALGGILEGSDPS